DAAADGQVDGLAAGAVIGEKCVWRVGTEDDGRVGFGNARGRGGLEELVADVNDEAEEDGVERREEGGSKAALDRKVVRVRMSWERTYGESACFAASCTMRCCVYSMVWMCFGAV